MGKDDQTGLPNRSIIGVLGYPLARRSRKFGLSRYETHLMSDAAIRARECASGNGGVGQRQCVYQNLERQVPIAATLDGASNPAVMTRFREVPGLTAYQEAAIVKSQQVTQDSNMRTTDTLTISLPPAMVKQMERVQKEEHRTRSELLREAWRQYFESRHGTYTPTKAELAAIRKGRAEIRRGEFATLEQLLHGLDASDRKASPKRDRKSSR